MLAKERRNLIVQELYTRGIITTSFIVKRFAVSIETARRDISFLEKQGLVRRFYGGAELMVPSSKDLAYEQRKFLNRSAKQEIGKKAAETVSDGDTIFIDGGTTTIELVKNIKHYSRLTVVTMSLPIVDELLDSKNTLYSLGGVVGRPDMTMTGRIALNALRFFHFDKAYIGAGGITTDIGITNHNQNEAELCMAAMQRSKKCILVADSSKFGTNASATVGTLDLVHMIITDDKLDDDVVNNIINSGIELYQVSSLNTEGEW